MANDRADDGQRRDDERLLARAEEALTEIKVSTGLSEPHAAVLAALRIRLRGDPGSSLDELMVAADDLDGPTLDDVLQGSEGESSQSLDDLLSKADKPKRSLDDLLG
jgi:hypothetical protein